VTAAARAEARAATMEAAVLGAPGSVRIEQIQVPKPGPRQVLIRIEGCGVCGSNIPVWTGDARTAYPLPPGEPGHEGWGTVERLGEEVAGLRAGERVTGLSFRSFAEFDVADAAHVVPIPVDLDATALPGEALACAVNAFRRSGVAAGQTVAVVGIGFLGALLTQLGARAGARVLAFARRPFARDVALTMGADDALPVERAAELDGACDVVIEAAGTQETLDVATRLVRVRGRLVIMGYHQDGPRQVDMQLWNWRGLDVVNAHERDPAVYLDGMRAAVDAVATGELDPKPLYTHRFPLAQIADAFTAAAKRPDGFLKALVMP
jgi:2-desacetyl-2-hydroxyethyl bacteriochlorophyllide A dehydrogenase